MGAFLSLLINVGALAAELSAETALSVESILTGEALAALEAEVASLMTIEGISGLEALAQLGFTAEQFSNFSLVSSLVNQALTYGIILQTVSGASSLISAGIRLGMSERSVVNQRGSFDMGPGKEILENFARGFVIDPLNWSGSLLHSIGKALWKSAEGPRRDLKLQTNFARLLEEGKWREQTQLSQTQGYDSGNEIASYGAPGGAHQRVCPDWMLPLILGLSGDIRPTWRSDLDKYAS